ncbi:MAG TPA: DUF6665 family protein [Kofleriaceae bacterium]|nr:DUF6665 family protein [Kofleriaceae bacterium]
MARDIDLMAGIEAELQNERMFALGQAGKKVEATLAALAAAPDARGGALEDLLHDAAYAVWSYLIMRESLGMFDHKEAMAIYGVPGRVMARVGVVRRAPSTT